MAIRNGEGHGRANQMNGGTKGRGRATIDEKSTRGELRQAAQLPQVTLNNEVTRCCEGTQEAVFEQPASRPFVCKFDPGPVFPHASDTPAPGKPVVRYSTEKQ